MANNKPKTNRAGNTHKVSQMDICQTPPHAIEPLLEYIPKDWIVWESAAGPEQLLANALENQGFFVIATDLLYSESFNFFDYEPGVYNIQITNMPFSVKYQWLKRSFELGKPFALLAPYETTFAKEWQVLFAAYNGNPWYIEILSPERRINYKMPNMGWGITEYDESKGKMVKRGDSAQMPTMWITWGLDVHNKRSDYLRTYYVPMRKVKYNADNTEKES
jgi:hypothetical protein